ncbi:hypothetical protein MUG78_17570 [Gordonia alkaliphila]|uniref:hypothetical protein n=1 Tax=Gordonia alkaliphila TaxID=1053547 RepID=UPI001FF55913|nr:hypothetical protein [Gordonia alkaliphila]MCK0441211.1 hypothetical protein [Gordonia alkaliphila]
MSFNNITEIREANAAAGHYWFNESCRAETKILGGRYWVESRPRERVPSDHPEGARWYAAVKANDDGTVEWFDTNHTRMESFEAARELLNSVL